MKLINTIDCYISKSLNIPTSFVLIIFLSCDMKKKHDQSLLMYTYISIVKLKKLVVSEINVQNKGDLIMTIYYHPITL